MTLRATATLMHDGVEQACHSYEVGTKEDLSAHMIGRTITALIRDNQPTLTDPDVSFLVTFTDD